MKIITFNVRTNSDEGLQSFDNRLPLMRDYLQSQTADIICMQEVKPEMYSAFRNALPSYRSFGKGRLADFSNEAVPFFYNPEVLKLIKGGQFWISKTPEVPGSRFDDCYWPRICTWGRFETIRSGKEFFVLNTHLDNKVGAAREWGAKLIADAVRKVLLKNSDMPVLICGDFNAEPDSEVVAYLNAQTDLRLRDLTTHFTYTYQGYGQEPPEKIDYFFVNKGIKDLCPVRMDEFINEQGTYMSDHWPLVLEFEV